MKVVEREIASAFIFSKDGYVLLGQNSNGGVYKDCWLIPGGGIEQSESPLEAVKREVLEEVGLAIDDEHISLIDDTKMGESEKVLKETDETVLVKMHFHDFRVDMSHNAADLEIIEGDGFCKGRWLHAHELKNMQLSPGVTEVLANLGYKVNYD